MLLEAELGCGSGYVGLALMSVRGIVVKGSFASLSSHEDLEMVKVCTSDGWQDTHIK